MRTSFVCQVGNEAVLKAFFKMDAKELTFGKVVAIAVEIEDAAKVAKLTTYGAKAMDATTPINKANPVQTAPK